MFHIFFFSGRNWNPELQQTHSFGGGGFRDHRGSAPGSHGEAWGGFRASGREQQVSQIFNRKDHDSNQTSDLNCVPWPKVIFN